MNVSISNIFIPTGKYSRWYKRMSAEIAVWVCGYADNGHRSYSGDALARMIADNVDDEWDAGVADFLKHLNGNWALIVLKGNIVYAACDRMRSYPLLYSELNGALRISDCITKMCGGRINWCSKGIEDFLWAGYPTGTSTLVDGVCQIPAGMYLHYDVSSKQKSLIQYFSFLPTSNNSDHEDQLSKRLSELLDEAIIRAGKVARGRIVVPLSGGMDSRVIAALLKSNGFEDVLCFSYGRKGNSESEASKRVAEALGYEWHFVEYSPQTWASCMFSQEMKDYVVFACNGCSMPVYNDWYAVKILRESGRVSAGDTFMPGHTGMLVFCHKPICFYNSDESIELKSLVECILRRNFSYWPGNPPERISLRLLEQFRSGMNEGPFNNLEANSLYQQWYWRERQAKMIINIDRVYEYFGCQWLTPLWDAFLIDYYLTIPLGLRHKKRLFIRASVENIFTDKLSVLSDIPLAGRGNFGPRRTLEFMQEERFRRVLHRMALKEKVKRCLLATRTGRMALKVKRCLLNNRTLIFPHHALMLSHSFSDGRDPRRDTVRQLFEKHGLGDFISRPECKSILEFVNTPVGYIHPFATSSLYGLGLMLESMEQSRQ